MQRFNAAAAVATTAGRGKSFGIANEQHLNNVAHEAEDAHAGAIGAALAIGGRVGVLVAATAAVVLDLQRAAELRMKRLEFLFDVLGQVDELRVVVAHLEVHKRLHLVARRTPELLGLARHDGRGQDALLELVVALLLIALQVLHELVAEVDDGLDAVAEHEVAQAVQQLARLQLDLVLQVFAEQALVRPRTGCRRCREGREATRVQERHQRVQLLVAVHVHDYQLVDEADQGSFVVVVVDRI